MVFAYGEPAVLSYGGPPWLLAFLSEDGWPHPVECEPHRCRNLDHAPHPDDVYMAELVLVDDGPGDVPGTREHLASIRNLRRVTREEWEAFLLDEWPWNEDGSALGDTRVSLPGPR